MLIHNTTSVLFVTEKDNSFLNPLTSYLASIPHIELNTIPRLPDNLSPWQVIVTVGTSALSDPSDRLTPFVREGGGWLNLLELSDQPLPDLFGAQPEPVGPAAELRVMFHDKDNPLGDRLPDAFYFSGRYHSLALSQEGIEIVLYADWQYSHRPVLTRKRYGNGQAACTTLQAYDHVDFQQILYRLLRQLAGDYDTKRSLGVGILGYSPYVGKAHGLGVNNTPGLCFSAACDLNPERLTEAETDFPGIRTYSSAEAFLKDSKLDVIIIATPPNTHAELALQVMDEGKHVVCEKPLALNRKESVQMVAMADRNKVHLSCHQNRRWDVDYLAIKQALSENLIGDLFYMETFVGSYNHPCGYWHSDARISGGTAYDWGGHYLDWIVSLMPGQVASVVGTRHKRVWHDVTNADQERIQIRYEDGREAEFLHSDIAAVRKPKWYLLGTTGAIVGLWQDITTFETDPVLFFHAHEIPETEMPPDLSLYQRHDSGQIVSHCLAIPERKLYAFHRNLADHLLTGEPIAAPLQHSVTVVAILEAASRSADRGGTVEVLDG